jgi:Fe-S-cluster containining protein
MDDFIHDDAFWDEFYRLSKGKVLSLPYFADDQVIYRLTKQYECEQCGECCDNKGKGWRIPLNAYDLHRMTRALGSTKVPELGVLSDGRFFIDASNGCPLLVNGKCSIYETRPLSCYQFPFQFAVKMDDGSFKLGISVRCKSTVNIIRHLYDLVSKDKTKKILPNLTVVEVKDESVRN